MNRDSNR